MEPLFVFARFLGMGSSEALTTTYLGIFQFLIFLIIFKTSIINVQLWASLEIPSKFHSENNLLQMAACQHNFNRL